ncbi:MAG: hypothetical protein J0G35_16870 [Acidobacteriales bacterium]|nr:hypothetical protein [Terriglobales bacterium]
MRGTRLPPACWRSTTGVVLKMGEREVCRSGCGDVGDPPGSTGFHATEMMWSSF